MDIRDNIKLEVIESQPYTGDLNARALDMWITLNGFKMIDPTVTIQVKGYNNGFKDTIVTADDKGKYRYIIPPELQSPGSLKLEVYAKQNDLIKVMGVYYKQVIPNEMGVLVPAEHLPTYEDFYRMYDDVKTGITVNSSNVKITPAGNIQSLNIQDAINELDTEKASKTDLSDLGNTKMNLNGDNSNVGAMNFNKVSPPIPISGQMAWNVKDETLQVGIGAGTDKVNIGLETLIKVINQSGATITRGTLVQFDGSNGNSGIIKIKPFDGTKPTRAVLGLTTADLTNGANGYVVNMGKLSNFNTTGSAVSETWADGDILYSHPTQVGKLTKVKPTAPKQKNVIGIVISASTNGIIGVKVADGTELGGTDSNVEITTPKQGDTLVYDGTKWANSGSKADKVFATNLIADGDFSSGTISGWIPINCTLEYLNGKLKATGNGLGNYIGLYKKLNTLIRKGATYYIRFKANTDVGMLSVRYYNGSTTPVITGQNGIFSAIFTATADMDSVIIYEYFSDASSQNGKTFLLDDIEVIDLTATYGVGNEPSKETMDRILAEFPNNFFNGTVELYNLKNLPEFLDDKANKVQEAWITPTLLNGWSDHSTGLNSAQFFKDNFGTLHIRGVIKGATINTIAFILPVGYRPAKTTYVPVASNNAFGFLSISPTGEVTPVIGNVSWFSLDGIQIDL